MPGDKHTPTDKTRGQVEAMSSFGITQEKIAKYLGISVPTLKRHYEEELELAKVDKIVAVANALYKNAVDKGNVTAQIFFLKTQAFWRETDKEEVTEDGKVGKIQIEVIKGKGETDEQ